MTKLLAFMANRRYKKFHWWWLWNQLFFAAKYWSRVRVGPYREGWLLYLGFRFGFTGQEARDLATTGQIPPSARQRVRMTESREPVTEGEQDDVHGYR